MATRSAKIDQKADLIWAIADKLTGVYKPHEYGDVILPLTVIRRFDCILSDTKDNATVDLDAVFGELQLINPRAKSFLSGIQTAFMASDIDMADELIRKRERSLKGAARAKLSRTKEFDHSKWVGGGMLDYRFSNARRIVNDIYAGEVNADV